MKKLLLSLTVALAAIIPQAGAQVFWTENFESGSSTGMGVASYTGPNGRWGFSVTGTEDSYANEWYVSCAEAGQLAGTCGADCATSLGLGATLHLGASAAFSGDGGASYNAGGLCSAGICVVTNRRAESPIINCTGHAGITMSFYYIENGDGTTDDGEVWFFDGTTWSMLANPAKTIVCSSGQGQWARLSYTLPSSADGNPNVKIGFRWVNNDDGRGTDPSFAIDSLSLSTSSSSSTVPVASFTFTEDTLCQDSCTIFTNTSTGTVDSFRWSIVGVPMTLPSISPFPLCITSSVPAGVYTIRLVVFGGGGSDTATHNIVLKQAPRPVITKTGAVLSVGTGYTSYQWFNGATAIAGATNNSYTYSGAGSYTVLVDSNGCKGISLARSTVGVSTLHDMGNKYWIAQPTAGALVLHADEPLDESLEVAVCDMTGRKLQVGTWARQATTTSLDAASLPAGMYLIRLSNEHTSVVIKWMK